MSDLRKASHEQKPIELSYATVERLWKKVIAANTSRYAPTVLAREIAKASRVSDETEMQ